MAGLSMASVIQFSAMMTRMEWSNQRLLFTRRQIIRTLPVTTHDNRPIIIHPLKQRLTTENRPKNQRTRRKAINQSIKSFHFSQTERD